MATDFSVIAVRIPGMGEPGGLPSMGLHSRTRLSMHMHTFKTEAYEGIIWPVLLLLCIP